MQEGRGIKMKLVSGILIGLLIGGLIGYASADHEVAHLGSTTFGQPPCDEGKTFWGFAAGPDGQYYPVWECKIGPNPEWYNATITQ